MSIEHELLDLRSRVLRAEAQRAQGIPIDDPVSDEELMEALKRARFDREFKGLNTETSTRRKKEASKLSSGDFNLEELF